MQRFTVYLKTALHVSGVTTTHHQERKQLYLQHLVFVTPLLLSAAIVEKLELVWVCCGWRTAVTAWQIPDSVDTVVCALDDGWWYHSKHVEQFPDKINCVTLHLVGYILEYQSINLNAWRISPKRQTVISLPSSNQPAPETNIQPVQTSTYFDINIPSTSKCATWSFLFRISHSTL